MLVRTGWFNEILNAVILYTPLKSFPFTHLPAHKNLNGTSNFDLISVNVHHIINNWVARQRWYMMTFFQSFHVSLASNSINAIYQTLLLFLSLPLLLWLLPLYMLLLNQVANTWCMPQAKILFSDHAKVAAELILFGADVFCSTHEITLN